MKFFVIPKRFVAMFYQAKIPRLNFQIRVDIQSNFDKNPHFRPFYVEKPSYNKMRCKMKYLLKSTLNSRKLYTD